MIPETLEPQYTNYPVIKSCKASPSPAKPAAPASMADDSTGSTPVQTEVEMLREQLRAMQLSNEAKDVENRNLQALLNEKQESDFDEGISDDALRKRLNRLCERKKNGHQGYIYMHRSNQSYCMYSSSPTQAFAGPAGAARHVAQRR